MCLVRTETADVCNNKILQLKVQKQKINQQSKCLIHHFNFLSEKNTKYISVLVELFFRQKKRPEGDTFGSLLQAFILNLCHVLSVHMTTPVVSFHRPLVTWFTFCPALCYRCNTNQEVKIKLKTPLHTSCLRILPLCDLTAQQEVRHSSRYLVRPEGLLPWHRERRGHLADTWI